MVYGVYYLLGTLRRVGMMGVGRGRGLGGEMVMGMGEGGWRGWD